MITLQDTIAPRIGENRDFTVILPDETIIITAVDTAVGVTINGYTQPTVPINTEPVTANIDMKINTATGNESYNSIRIASGVQGIPYLADVRMIPTFAMYDDYNCDFNLRFEKYEGGSWVAINTAQIVVNHLEISYILNGDTEWATIHVYDAQFNRLSDGYGYNYRYRYTEPQSRIIDGIEAFVEQPTTGDTLYSFGMTSPTLSVSLRRNTSTPFYPAGQTTSAQEFYYYAAKADRWKNATVALIVGAENIIANSETLSFHTYGVDMTWISNQLIKAGSGLGYLITNGTVNKWSWRKPCKIGKTFVPTDTNIDYTLSNTRNGMEIPNAVGAGSTILEGTWAYEKPTGTAAYPYRFADMYGYNKNAVIPFEIEIPSAISVNPTGVQVKLILKSGLKQSNIQGANAMGVNWFGVMIKKDTSVYYKTHANSVGSGGLILDISDCTLFASAGTVTVYCLLSSAAITSWVASATTTIFSLNGEDGIAYKTITLT